MKQLTLVEGELPAVWHVVVVKDSAVAKPLLPPIQTFLATESEMRKAVELFRRKTIKGVL
jgi:hypothetical protein